MSAGHHRAECPKCEHWYEGTYLRMPYCTSLMHGCGCKFGPIEKTSISKPLHDMRDKPAPVGTATVAEPATNAVKTGTIVPESGTPLDTQVGGQHYKDMAIQPVEFIHANGIGYFEGCAIKYLSRWRKKNGIEDLRKAIHFIELLIELEGRKKNT